MRIGYACINTQLPAPNRSCRLKNATPARILDLAAENVSRMEPILRWNLRHGIKLFRISSDVIPFGSHPINRLAWRDMLAPQLNRLGKYIRAHGMRVSMHPGQFTVLNSPRPEVVDASVKELAYHASFLDALGLNDQHKIVIHLGGVYGDKAQSLKRFIAAGNELSGRIRARLVLENDERCYSIADALHAAAAIGVPVVFDVFHHRWNPAFKDRSLRSIIQTVARTWRRRDGRVKIHYSNQWPGMPPGTHSRTINIRAFRKFHDEIGALDLDVMLEVKDKEQSVLKLMRSLQRQ